MSEEKKDIKTDSYEILKDENLNQVAGGGCLIHSSFETVESFRLDNGAHYIMLRCPDCGETRYLRTRNMDGSETVNSRAHRISPAEFYAVKETLRQANIDVKAAL